MKYQMMLAGALAAVGMHAPAALAQAVDERVVVVATKAPRSTSQTGNQVTIITKDEIDRKGAVFAIDVLRDVPGVAVSQNGGPGGFAAIRLRGEEGYRTLIVLDGMKLSDPSGTQVSFNIANLLARDIERIEILRGPQALLYGADVIGGVIAISTRRGGAQTEAGLRLEGGSFGTVQGGAFVRGSTGALDAALTLSGFDNDGISAKAGPAFVEDDAFTHGAIHGVVGLSLAPGLRLEGVGRYTDSRSEFDGFAGEDNILYTEQFTGRLSANLQSADDRWSAVVALAYMTQNRADYENGAPFAFGSRFDGERWRLEALGRWQAWQGHDIVLGADWEDESATTDVLDRGRTIAGIYAEYQGQVTPSAFVTLGLRFDDHEQFGQHLSWRATAAQTILSTPTDRLVARASAGTGFRAPSLFELFDTFSGDPTLTEETGQGWDIGLEWEWVSQGTVLSVAYFDQRVTDEIRFDPNLFVYIQNPSQTTSQGVETSLSAQVTSDLTVQAAYTYTDATIGSNDAEDGLQRLRRPRHVTSLSVDYRIDGGRGALNATLQSAVDQVDGFFVFRSPLDDRAILNLSARYNVLDDLTLTLRGQNVLDERYQEATGFNAPRAGIFAGMDWTL